MALPIQKIVIHCSATRNGKALRAANQTAAQAIDGWHKGRGFQRAEWRYQQFNPHLKHIGYHFVIDVDGTVETGRAEGETGAHVRGHNLNSLGICLVGGVTAGGKNHGEYTPAQWQALHRLLQKLRAKYPTAKICGHRDLSPDLNGDGTITPNEWIKDCPCFSTRDWLASGEVINQAHLWEQ